MPLVHVGMRKPIYVFVLAVILSLLLVEFKTQTYALFWAYLADVVVMEMLGSLFSFKCSQFLVHGLGIHESGLESESFMPETFFPLPWAEL